MDTRRWTAGTDGRASDGRAPDGRAPDGGAPVARDRFGRLLRAEWTKLRSVLGTAGCLLAAAGGLLAGAVMVSSGSPGTYDGAPYVDEFRFAHRPLAGDGTLVARVRDQAAGHPWAMAGIMVKQTLTPGAPYAALAVTAGHGIRLQSNFTTDIAATGSGGGGGTVPRWLRLTRAGDTITGYESHDGTRWREVGAVRLAGLAPAVEVGMFVTSPGVTRIHPMRPALAQLRPATANFDAVALTPAGAQPAVAWRADDVGGRVGADPTRLDQAGVFTLTGSGDIIGQSDDGSRIIAATAGTIFAVLPAIALGVLAVTGEYRWRLVLTTFAATPRRGRVLAAKAVIVGGATFAAAAAAATAALLASQPLLERNGYRPPVYPDPSLADPAALRVIAGTAGFLALLALLGLGAGAVLRRGAAAIAVVAAAVFVPVLAVPLLPAAAWGQRLSPAAGLSAQQLRETDDALLLPWAGRPWTGLLILAGYAAAALTAGYWLIRRRDG